MYRYKDYVVYYSIYDNLALILMYANKQFDYLVYSIQEINNILL
jgi:hypothetical protein